MRCLAFPRCRHMACSTRNSLASMRSSLAPSASVIVVTTATNSSALSDFCLPAYRKAIAAVLDCDRVIEWFCLKRKMAAPRHGNGGGPSRRPNAAHALEICGANVMALEIGAARQRKPNCPGAPVSFPRKFVVFVWASQCRPGGPYAPLCAGSESRGGGKADAHTLGRSLDLVKGSVNSVFGSGHPSSSSGSGSKPLCCG